MHCSHFEALVGHKGELYLAMLSTSNMTGTIIYEQGVDTKLMPNAVWAEWCPIQCGVQYSVVYSGTPPCEK